MKKIKTGLIKWSLEVVCGCTRCANHFSGVVKERSARTVLNANGWRYKPKYGWHCPECVEKLRLPITKKAEERIRVNDRIVYLRDTEKMAWKDIAKKCKLRPQALAERYRNRKYQLFRKLPKKEQNKIIRKEEREFKLQNQRQLERGICMYYGCSSRASFIDIGKKVTTGVCVKCNALSLVPDGRDKESYASGFVSGWFWDVEGPLPKNVYLPTSGKDDRYSLSWEEGFNDARSLRDTPLEDGNVWAFTDEVDDASKPQIQVPRPWKAIRVYWGGAQ